jgi:hypothetical protein
MKSKIKPLCYKASECEAGHQTPNQRYCAIKGVAYDTVRCWISFKCIKCGKPCPSVGNYIIKDHCIPCGKEVIREKHGNPKKLSQEEFDALMDQVLTGENDEITVSPSLPRMYWRMIYSSGEKRGFIQGAFLGLVLGNVIAWSIVGLLLWLGRGHL